MNVNEPAIVVLTPHGAELGRRMVAVLGEGEIVRVEKGSLSPTLTALFHAGRPLVCVMALGIVVRILGPQTHDKQKEPAVVVVDEAGRFAVSVLGGHQGGANSLAKSVAIALDAVPVITTASDVLGLPALDLIGKHRHWQIENPEALKSVSAAMIRGEPIAVYQDAGTRDWWQEFGPWPPTFQRVGVWVPGRWRYSIVITDRAAPLGAGATLVLRPPSLVLGVGCKRGVPCAEIETLFLRVCRQHAFSPRSLGLVATVSLKADEPGLIEFARAHAVAMQCFSVADLSRVGNLPSPSERVLEKIGLAGVAEPSALLAAGTTALLLPKQKAERVTMALARREDA